MKDQIIKWINQSTEIQDLVEIQEVITNRIKTLRDYLDELYKFDPDEPWWNR